MSKQPSRETLAKLRALASAASGGEASWFHDLLLEAGYSLGRVSESGHTAREIAAIFGVTPQAVGLWVKKEGCPRDPDGTLDLAAVVKWYLSERGSLATEDQDRLDAAKLKKAEHEAALSELKESRERLEFEVERGKWMLQEDVEAGWSKRARSVRDTLLRLAKELPPRLEHRSGREIQTVLEKVMEHVCQKYSGEGGKG